MLLRGVAFLVVATLCFGESQRALDFIARGWFLAIGTPTGSVTEYSVTRKLGQPLNVARREEPNRHEPDAMNEIVEMQFDGFGITLLKTPEKILVSDVVITGPRLLVLEGFRVGTPAARLKELGEGRMERGRRCYHNLQAYDDSACFTVRDGVIAQVEWRYEID
jgi:hypothetical protein